MATVRMSAASIGGTINTAFTGPVTVPSDGIITVDVRDVPSLLAAGATYINAVSRWYNTTAPRAGSAARIVASTNLSNGTLAIANQPDIPRIVNMRVDPGTSAVTAGNVAVAYIANDGTTTTDNMSAIASASTPVTVSTSKGVSVMNSVIITAVAGGTSPGVELTDTNILAMPVDPGFQDFNVLKTTLDGANATMGTATASAGAITVTTTPNGTHTYGFQYNYNMPNT